MKIEAKMKLLTGAVCVFLFFPFVVMFAWWALVPDILSGMVEMDMLPMSISWWQGFKIMCFGCFLFARRISSNSQ